MNKDRLKNKQKENKVFFHPLLCPFRELTVDSFRETANKLTGVKTPYTKCTDGSAAENMEFSEWGSLHQLHGLWRSRSKRHPSFPVISLSQPCIWSDTSCSMMTENMREAGNWAHYVWPRCPSGMEESILEALMLCILREHKAESGNWSLSLLFHSPTRQEGCIAPPLSFSDFFLS